MAEVVEAVALALETRKPQRRVPDPLAEVRRLERSAAHRSEDELVRRITAALDRAGGQLSERSVDGREEWHGADTRFGLRTP